MTKKKKGGTSISKTKGSSSQRKQIGGLSDYVVSKDEKEVIFYLPDPYPTCMAIPKSMERFPEDCESIVTRDLDEFKKYRGQV